jgi:acyl transferase domain-containing protein
MSGRFPGAADVESFRDNIRRGVDSISRYDVHDLESRVHPSGSTSGPRQQDNEDGGMRGAGEASVP